MTEWLKAPDWKLRSQVVDSVPSRSCNFSTQDCQKINKAPSVTVVHAVTIDYFCDSFKGVDHVLTPVESLLYQIIIIPPKQSEVGV